MANTINLSSLKSSNKGKNIEGKELRDFGNGKKEFDPAANGIFAAPEQERKSDRDIALETLDSQLAVRRKEAEEFNRLLDEHDGVMTEEEYLKATGKSFISDMLDDHTTEEEKKEIEEMRAANRAAKEVAKQEAENPKIVSMPNSNNDVTDSLFNEKENSELDDIEKEILAEEDNIMPIARGTEVTGNFDATQLQQHNPIQPQMSPDNFVDPNLNRPHPAQQIEQTNSIETTEIADKRVAIDAVAEKESTADKDIEIPDHDEFAEENIALGVEKIQGLPKATIADAVDTAVTGDLSFEAPKQRESIKDENGLTEEEKDLAALDENESISLDDDEDDDADNEAYWKKIGKEYAKKVKPVIRKLNLNAAIVSTEPVTVNTMISKNTSVTNIFKWVLPTSGRPFSMRSFTATELNSLGAMAGTASRAKDIIKSLWDHMVDGKGDNFDKWCKVTSHKDLVHLWFGVYGGCFAGANYVPYVCPKCKQATIADNIDIYSMVEYKTTEIKERVEKILNMPMDADMGKIMPVSRVQISDDVVIDFKDPSVYDILTTNLIDNGTRQKYPEGVAMLPYIENIYYIEETANGIRLRPLAVKVFPGNEAKTLQRKAIQYSMIIRSLNSEQYSTVSSYISQLTDSDDGIIYIYPETTCDHCHVSIPKIETNASEMVFTRHRLAIAQD